MKHKYGEFSKEQITEQMKQLRKSIFWLLLYKDPNIDEDYSNVDFDKYFEGLMCRMAGFGQLIGNPVEIVTILSILEAAKLETEKVKFEFKTYRKLILDAGSMTDKLNI